MMLAAVWLLFSSALLSLSARGPLRRLEYSGT